MSKRFGRNQRRRMREQVANLQQAVEMDRALLSRQRTELGQLQDEIDEAKDIAGQFSAVMRPTGLVLPVRTRRTIELESSDRPSMSMCADAEHQAVTWRRVPLDVMLAEINPSESRMDEALHARVTFADGRWGYAMSRGAIETIPLNVMVKRLSIELARVIAPELRKHYGRRA